MPSPTSRAHLVRDLRTALVTLVVASVVVATPSVAAKIVNADQVDGFSAVKAKAKLDKRKKKLVATDKQGYLPNDIIRKASDADRLDGVDSTALVAKTAAPGDVLIGEWAGWGGGVGGYVGDNLAFGQRIPVAIPPARITVLGEGAPATAQCPGVGQVVPRAWLCVYTAVSEQVSDVVSYNSTDGSDGSSLVGFGLYGDCDGTFCYQYGSWALRVGSASDVPPRTTPRSGANPH